MKKGLQLMLVVFGMLNNVSAQVLCFTDDFSDKKASGWDLSQGARITNYNNPMLNCIDDRGIITPGVGGNNPCNIETPVFVSTGANTLNLSFDIFCFDANLKCKTWKDYDCTTSLDVFYIVNGVKYTGVTDFILPPNGPVNSPAVSFDVPVGNNLPEGANYRIRLEFKFKSGVGNCVQQNTKYILDNFTKCQPDSRVSRTMNPGIIPEKNSYALSVFPNPSNGSDMIRIEGQSNTGSIQILDNSGRIIRTLSNHNSGYFNISGLHKGLYFVRYIKQANGGCLTKKLVIN